MYKNGKRVMALTARIDNVIKHPNADTLDICSIGGWNVITRLNEYKKNDLVIFISIDAWVPNSIASFLSKGNEPKEYNGVKGERLRTVKLRNVISQGLILPLTVLSYEDLVNIDKEGIDVSGLLNIQLWEAPIPACLNGVMKGSFPSFIPKTDSERLQNLVSEFDEWKNISVRVEISEKCDGSSMTVYVMDGEFGVCSRNLDLEKDENNTYWKVAIRENFEEKLRSLNKNVAIQGECIGSAINGNIYKMKDQDFYLFNVYDINEGRYYTQKERFELANKLKINHVPVIELNYMLSPSDTIESLLKFADGKSKLNPAVAREGLVFKAVNNSCINWKCISNQYLLKEK